MSVHIKGNIEFKIRFNTMHGDTDFFWRIIVEEEEYLAKTLHCMVHTRSDASFDKKANTIKYHIAGTCIEFMVDENANATFK